MTAETPVEAQTVDGAGNGDEDGAGGKMPLLDHLIELRSRMLKSLLAIGIAFGVCLYFAKSVLGILVHPLVMAGQDKLIYTQLFEAFFVEMKVALFAAMMISFPVIANQLWKFVEPGLYRKEKRALLPFLFATPVLFAAGACFAYFVTVPIALRFLLGFQGDIGGIQQEALPSAGHYLSFIMQFLMAFGLAFLLPILLMLIERAGLVTREQLMSARRYMIVAFFAIAAVFTPPDVISQLLLAVPLVLLYEMSLLAIWFTQRRRKTGAEAAPVEPLEEA
jgi:sec-independent protein translocase protein TatC